MFSLRYCLCISLKLEQKEFLIHAKSRDEREELRIFSFFEIIQFILCVIDKIIHTVINRFNTLIIKMH